MVSTVLELAGFCAIIAATFLVAGLAAALFVTGPVLLLCGYAVEDEKAVMALSRAVTVAARPVRGVRARLTRRGRRELAKAA